jgi:hypothetical protein
MAGRFNDKGMINNGINFAFDYTFLLVSWQKRGITQRHGRLFCSTFSAEYKHHNIVYL